ncbi:MAG: outer membrane protein assembly factor BamA [Gammaproteobacteria bacterium]|nr:outer membrane protein assembly factor BamA [Gammaproteobacteria bacterium]
MKNKLALLLFFLTSCGYTCTSAYAAEFKLNNIKIFGLQRVDDGVVLNALPVAIGENFNTEDTSEYIKSIYKTGYFKSITINRDNNNILIYVKEKPSIATIKIVGNDSMDTEVLNKALSGVDIKDGGTFDEFTVQKVTQELEQQYLSQGKYAVRIKTDVKALERNRIGLVINISEGRVAKIRKIKIIGNKKFSDQVLLTDFSLSEGGLISWFTLSDRYSKQKLAGDLEKLKSFYLNRGYLNFKINDAQISLTPDKKNVYITIQITEGESFKVGKINLGGKYSVINPDLKKLITLQSGEIYSAKKATESETAILNNLGQAGYSLAKVDINKNINFTDKTVGVTFFVTPGNRVYVRRITFAGNIKTKDEVLRRELMQMESGFVSREKIELSKQRLYQLGYIKDINVETVPVTGNNDQVDLKYTLEEVSTGHLNGGVGYSEAEGVMFNLGISQDNFLGTGKSVSADFNKSPATINAGLKYFDPYFTIDGIGLGYNVYYSKTKLGELDISNYRLDQYGFDASLNLPLTLYDSIGSSLGIQNKTVIISKKNTSAQIRDFVTKHDNSFNLFPMGANWRHSKLDRMILPTSGWSNQLGAMITLPFSGLTYYSAYNTTKLYLPVYNEFVLHFKTNIAYGSGYGGDHFPFFDHYFAGGSGSVRGFVQNSLGPRDSLNEPFGGSSQLTGTAELFLPRLFATNAPWRPSIFVDAGNVFKHRVDLGELRASAGTAIQWLSPIGALNVSYAVPLKKQTNDHLRGFNFSFGSSF